MARHDIKKTATMEVLPPENDLLMSSWAKSFVSLIWKSFSVAIPFPEYNYKEQLQTLSHRTAPHEATLQLTA